MVVWFCLVGEVERIKFVSKPGSCYNLAKCDRYLNNQAASSIKSSILAHNFTPDQLYDRFMKLGIKLNADQKAMVRKYRGDDFVFDFDPFDEPYELPFDFKKYQNKVDLINAILSME